MKVRALQGETLDALCWRHYRRTGGVTSGTHSGTTNSGTTNSGTTSDTTARTTARTTTGIVEAVLEANPGLAALDVVLPMGTEVEMPELNMIETTTPLLRLFD